MANVALLIAGGSGNRMRQDIPKQFITVNERPVIVYTLEAFEKHTVVQDMMLVLSRFDIGYNAKIFCGIKPERIRSRNISYTEILDFSTQHTLEIIGNLINSI